MNIEEKHMGRSFRRLLSTAAARFRSHVGACGPQGGTDSTGAGFTRVLWFPQLTVLTAVDTDSIVK
jgi:hypothetical protein